MKRITFLAILFFMIACTPPNQNGGDGQTNAEPAPEDLVDRELIAKAAISALFSEPIRTMKVRVEVDIYHVTYVKAGEEQSYKIHFSTKKQNTLNWGNSDGRWRDSKFDEKLSYQIDGQDLVIKISNDDDSVSEQRFNIDKLNPS